MITKTKTVCYVAVNATHSVTGYKKQVLKESHHLKISCPTRWSKLYIILKANTHETKENEDKECCSLPHPNVKPLTLHPKLLRQQTKDPAEEMDYVSQDTNATLCTYLKQFKLSGSKRISFCAYNQHVRVDIRRFIDDKATIQVIWINSEEWLALIRLQGKINLSMTFAKNN